MLSRSALLCFPAALLLTLAASGLAVDRVSFTAVDGRVFKDVAVTRTLGRKLEVMTPTGAQMLRYGNLPREMQDRFFAPSLRFPPKVGDELEFKTLDGRAFKGPLREIAPNGISLETPDGLEKVPYSNLPPELANTFDYDAEDAARYEAALRAQQQRAFAAKQAAEKKAAAQRAATDKAAAKTTTNRKPSPADVPMGNRGSQDLGAPRLGGSGLGK
jgi:hypothetical protein